MLTYKLPLQPFVFLASKSKTITDIDAAYVVVDRVTYRVESVYKAVDVCFKCFHALHAVYPAESYAVWLFIQRVVYDFETEWDRSSISLNTLLSSW